MNTSRWVVCALTIGAGLAMGGTTLAAADPGPGSCGEVGCPAQPTAGPPQSGPIVNDPGATATFQSSGGLAFTGTDIAEMTIVAFGAIAIGSALRHGSRRISRRTIPS